MFKTHTLNDYLIFPSLIQLSTRGYNTVFQNMVLLLFTLESQVDFVIKASSWVPSDLRGGQGSCILACRLTGLFLGTWVFLGQGNRASASYYRLCC